MDDMPPCPLVSGRCQQYHDALRVKAGTQCPRVPLPFDGVLHRVRCPDPGASSVSCCGRTQIDLLGSLRLFIQPSSYALSRSTGLIWTAPSPSPPRATSLLTCYPACFSEAVIPAYIYRLALTALCRSSVRLTVRRTSRAKKVLEFGRISSRTSPVVLYDLFLASRLGNVSGECY